MKDLLHTGFFYPPKKNVDCIMHNEQQGFFGKLYRSGKRSWMENIHGKLCLHESVLKRTKNRSNGDSPAYSSWILQFERKEIESDK